MQRSVARSCSNGFAVLSLCLCGSSQTIAAQTFFFGRDQSAVSLATMPIAVAASDSWEAAAGLLGPLHLIDFESPYASGSHQSLLLAPGVTLTATVTNSEFGPFAQASFTIASNATGYATPLTFNTTLGGSYYAGLNSCSTNNAICTSSLARAFFTFTFDRPIQAFGLYITGRGQGNRRSAITFNDPAPQTTPLTGGGVYTGQFGGFTDGGAAISSVTIEQDNSSYNNLVDSYVLDDVRWVYLTPEPSPRSLVLMCTVPIVVLLRMRRKSHNPPR